MVIHSPGRMNLFSMDDGYSVLLDYAHNPAGYEAVGQFVKNWEGDRIGVIGGPGDRRDEDLILLGQISARLFNHVIIKEDDDKRGRENGEVADLILKGVLSENPDISNEIIIDEKQALLTAFEKVKKDGLVVVFPESVMPTISLIEQHQHSS